jgi:ArsR family transcriptional regulator
MEKWLCEEEKIHAEAIDAALDAKRPDGEIQSLANLYKIFADPTRLKIIFALERGPLCVCDLSEVLGMTASAVSHQLSLFRQAKIVKTRREGKCIFYALADAHIHTILRQGYDHIKEENE